MERTSSFYINHPSAVQLLCLTETYLIAGTVSGMISILDLQCRHTESSNTCEHRTTIEVGRVWDLDCYANMLVTGNEDGKVQIWDARTG
jgi:WD40 repeat protein